MTDELKQNIRRGSTWERLLYVILFVFIYSVAEAVLAAVVVVQFGFVLITAKPNEYLLRFGDTLSRFLYDVLRYFTFTSDHKPFPFAAWPSAGRAPPTA
jgi:hypothetical protein